MTAARIVAVSLFLFAACAPAVAPLGSPVSVEAFCGSKQARNTGIASVLSSTDDKLLDDRPTDTDVRRAVRSGDGVIAHYNDLLLLVPNVAKSLGSSDGYARVRLAAIPPAVEDALTRHIFLYVFDHGGYRWIMMSAYDVQNVCVEGKRDA